MRRWSLALLVTLASPAFAQTPDSAPPPAAPAAPEPEPKAEPKAEPAAPAAPAAQAPAPTPAAPPPEAQAPAPAPAAPVQETQPAPAAPAPTPAAPAAQAPAPTPAAPAAQAPAPTPAAPAAKAPAPTAPAPAPKAPVAAPAPAPAAPPAVAAPAPPAKPQAVPPVPTSPATPDKPDSELTAEEYTRKQVRNEARYIFGNLLEGDVRNIAPELTYPFQLEDKRYNTPEELVAAWVKQLRQKRTDLISLYDVEVLPLAEMEKKYGKAPARLGLGSLRDPDIYAAVGNLSGRAAVLLFRAPKGGEPMAFAYTD